MKRKSNAEKTATEMIGDGKTPNLYWVCVSGSFLTNRRTLDGGEMNYFEGSDEAYPQIAVKPGRTEGPFKTYKAALECANRIAEREITEPIPGAPGFHTVCIEDRLSGVIMEGVYTEYWRKSVYRGVDTLTVSTEFEWRDDTRFTREKLGSNFI